MQKCYQLMDGRVCDADPGKGEIMIFLNPSEAEKKFLVDELKLDEHTLSSALDPDELARLEYEPDHIALIFKHPKNYSAADKFLFRVSSMGLFLFKDKLVILAPDELPTFSGKYFSRLTSLRKAMLSMMYRSVFHFIEHLKIINMITDSLEQKINAAMENKYLLNLFTLEKSLVYYLNAINSNAMVIEKIKNNAAKFSFDTDSLEFLDDLIVENSQCFKQAEIYSNILTGLMDARGTIVGNNLNVLMKTLNIITIAIMVPTFVVSVFSMNVGLPLQNHRLAFWIVMALAIISVVAFLVFWKRKKWY